MSGPAFAVSIGAQQLNEAYESVARSLSMSQEQLRRDAQNLPPEAMLELALKIWGLAPANLPNHCHLDGCESVLDLALMRLRAVPVSAVFGTNSKNEGRLKQAYEFLGKTLGASTQQLEDDARKGISICNYSAPGNKHAVITPGQILSVANWLADRLLKDTKTPVEDRIVPKIPSYNDYRDANQGDATKRAEAERRVAHGIFAGHLFDNPLQLLVMFIGKEPKPELPRQLLRTNVPKDAVPR